MAMSKKIPRVETKVMVLMTEEEHEFLIQEAERNCRSKSAQLRYLLRMDYAEQALNKTLAELKEKNDG